MFAGLPRKQGFALDVCCLGLFALAFATLLMMFAWRPLAEPDFWWHLKTGEVIVKGGRLLAADPFNFTADPSAVSIQEHLTLNAYWLWQIIAYGFYQAGGFIGIKVLNTLTVAVTYAVIGWSMLRNRVRVTIALPLLLTSLYLYYKLYYLERPQVMTFVFAAMVIALIIEIRGGARPSPWLYPLMMVWANMHGGVVSGAALLGVFAVGSIWDCRHERSRLKAILVWCAGGMLASVVSPNGFDIYRIAAKMPFGDTTATVMEFASPFERLPGFPWVFIPLLLLLLAHFAALCINWRRAALAEWLVSIFLVALGLMYMRTLAFIAVALVPMTAQLLAEAIDWRKSAVQMAGKWVALTAIAMLCVLSFTDVVQSKQWRREAWPELNRDEAPQALAQFLESASLQGNILNDYDWGGYLLWRLYPEYKFFIDGRNLRPKIYDDYLKILGVSLVEADGKPEYERLLDRYEIDYVVMKNQMNSGLVQKLLKYLLTDKKWHPIYLDNNGFILAKNSEKTAKFISQYGVSKKIFLDRLLAYYDRSLQKYPWYANFYLFRGELLGYMGRYADADRDFAMVKQLAPDHLFLADKLRQLQKLREKTKG